jgi:hypothetical protein
MNKETNRQFSLEMSGEVFDCSARDCLREIHDTTPCKQCEKLICEECCNKGVTTCSVHIHMEKKRGREDDWIVFVAASVADGAPVFTAFKIPKTSFFTLETIQEMVMSDPAKRTELGVPGCNCNYGKDLDADAWEEITLEELSRMDHVTVIVGYLDEY